MTPHNQAMVYLFGKLAFECCQIYTIFSLLKLKLIQKFWSVDDVGLIMIHRTMARLLRFCLSLCVTKNITEGAEDKNVYKAENNEKVSNKTI